MCIAFNKKNYSKIKLNGGGDLCDPTLDGNLLNQYNLPNERMPIWNYDSVFKTKEIISADRARSQELGKPFDNLGNRGGGQKMKLLRLGL